jgi:Cu-processing system ATP-binding protein
MSAGSMVDVRGVTRHYGSVRAVDGVDLKIERGVVFGLLGHNGAGKSTIIRILLGLERPTSGEVRIDGVALGQGDMRAVRRQIGYLPEQVVLYDNLTGIETLAFFAALKGVPKSACRAALDRVGLGAVGQRRVGEYSKGMRQRLGLAQALLGSPRLLFLDEPTTALDPEAVRAFYALLRELEADGVTIVLSSHSLSEIQDRVTRLAIMVAGRVRASGTVAELRDHVALPLAVRLTVRPGSAGAIRSMLDGMPVVDLDSTEGRLSFRCPRDAKMAILAALAPRRADVVDIDVQEPSLEDVFFGVAR